MDIQWEDNYEIAVRIENGVTVISANQAGLKSLAKIMNDMAERDGNTHIHLDKNNSLDDGSSELIIEKI